MCPIDLIWYEIEQLVGFPHQESTTIEQPKFKPSSAPPAAIGA